MDDAERGRAWAALAAVDLPARALVALLRAFGTPQAVLDASAASVTSLVGADAAAAIRARDREREARIGGWLDDDSHRLVALDDPAYPARLLEAGDPPPVLYAIGDIARLQAPSIAIVGSRNATPQGQEDAREFARTLADAGLTVVSGLAVGIDAAAHRGALASPASTVAVTGTGPDRVYPAGNRELAHEIAQRGCIVTPFAPGTPPLKGNFPRRNRIIAASSLGVLVVEAAPRSGSLVTARQAVECGREVFAIPGSIHSPLSKGPHELIRQGAKLVESAHDVLAELRLTRTPPAGSPGPGSAAVADLPAPDGDHRRVLESMGAGPVGLDRLVTRTGLAADTLASMLVQLELDGHVRTLPGGRWQRRG